MRNNVKFFVFAILLLMSPLLYADVKNPFTTICVANKEYTLNVLTEKSIDIDLPIIELRGLSVDGRIIQKSNRSFVRILLENSDGKTYLVLETSRLRNENDTIVLSKYCEETLHISPTKGSKLRCIIKDATVELFAANIVTGDIEEMNINEDDVLKLRTLQVQDISNSMNAYNKKHGKLWYAGITDFALMDFAERKRHLFIDDETDTEGIEFYSGGIFDIGEWEASPAAKTSSSSSQYVESFDWRNRHGKNWTTSVKNQGASGYCTAFATCSMMEARTNIYFNQKLDLDLSEQDAVYSNAREGNRTLSQMYNNGINIHQLMETVVHNGILDETSVPFIDACQTSIPVRPYGNERIGINSCSQLTNPLANPDTLKHIIINYGPAVSGFNTKSGGTGLNHALALMGYHTIHAGDTVFQVKSPENGGLFSAITVLPGSPYVGRTYWVFKDNYGDEAEGKIGGYLYLLFIDETRIHPVSYTTSPIIRRGYSDADILVTDDDGDGYYYWGIGPKPPHCPDWVPDIPDGNDANYAEGPMDEYGIIQNLNPDLHDTIYVRSDSIISQKGYLYNHVVICNGGTLHVNSDLVFYDNVKMIIEDGGTLIVDNCIIENADINVESGANVIIQENGNINLARQKGFFVPLGATTSINNGTIITKHN